MAGPGEAGLRSGFYHRLVATETADQTAGFRPWAQQPLEQIGLHARASAHRGTSESQRP